MAISSQPVQTNQAQVKPVSQPAGQMQSVEEKKWYTLWWMWLLIVVVIGAGVGVYFWLV